MLQLITYEGKFGEPSASPFCVKAMCLLNMAGVEWEPVYSNDPRSAPKQKLPVLLDGSIRTPDSDQIRDYLESRTGVDLDEGLSGEQRAASRAVIRMVEEHSYFAIVCDRWVNDENWVHIRKAFFSDIQALIRGFVTRQIRKQAIGQVKAQGMGRHSAKERFDRVRKDIAAIDGLLGDNQFLFGDQATAADASVVPILRAMAAAPVATDLSKLVQGNDRLKAYLDRGKAAFYPAEIVAQLNLQPRPASTVGVLVPGVQS